MSANRFRDRQFRPFPDSYEPLPEPTLGAAFVACPLPVLQAMTPAQQSQAELVYQLAWKQAHSQESSPLSAFSLN
jgi:hypothetical protein